MFRHFISICVILFPLCASLSMAADWANQAPPGSHIKLSPESHQNCPTFQSGQPVIGTTYFYWYDIHTGLHVKNPDGSDAMTTHPPAEEMANLSYKSADWHYAQLRDVSRAGIDFILPVFWGFPGVYDQWSFAGLPPLIVAHERILAEHKNDPSIPAPPAIGMFYDTTTLMLNVLKDGQFAPGQHIDLGTPEGKEWFYVTIRDYFSMIPPTKWARVDGKPIVFLYAGEFVKGHDPKLFEDTRARFQADFGTDLFIVKNADWPGQADAWYRWGGSHGLILGDHVAALGPGYDHTATGRPPRIWERQEGQFYAHMWETLLSIDVARRPWMVHVETWNEWHEATDIARSQEYGDQYIRLTAHYAQLFHQQKKLEVSGPFAGLEQITWTPDQAVGLFLQPPGGDGCWSWTMVADRPAAVTVSCANPDWQRFLYFDIADSFAFDLPPGNAAEIGLDFLDNGGCEKIAIDYDNHDPKLGAANGAFRRSTPIAVGNSGQWRQETLILPAARFVNRANGHDFRIHAAGGNRELTLRGVTLRIVPEPPQPPPAPPAPPATAPPPPQTAPATQPAAPAPAPTTAPAPQPAPSAPAPTTVPAIPPPAPAASTPAAPAPPPATAPTPAIQPAAPAATQPAAPTTTQPTPSTSPVQ